MHIYREDDMEDFDSAEEDIDDEDPFVGWSEYVLSDDWDFVVDRKWRHGELKITTYLKCKPHENMTFNLSTKQWAKLLYHREKIVNEVNALHNKSQPVNFRVHIGDYYFMSMKDGWDYVHIFQHLPHPLKCYADSV